MVTNSNIWHDCFFLMYVRMFSALTWLQDDLIVSGQLCASTDYEVSLHSFMVFLAVTDHFHHTPIDLGTTPPPLSRCWQLQHVPRTLTDPLDPTPCVDDDHSMYTSMPTCVPPLYLPRADNDHSMYAGTPTYALPLPPLTLTMTTACMRACRPMHYLSTSLALTTITAHALCWSHVCTLQDPLLECAQVAGTSTYI